MYSLNDITLNDIELNIAASDWRNAIKLSSNELLRNNVITPEYVDAMIKSVEEFGPYIVLSKGVALAHARPEDGALQTALYFTTLKAPVEFKSEEFDPVSLIIVLAAKDSESHLELLAQLSTILEDEKTIDRLIQTDNKEEFLEIIKGAN